MKNQIAIFEASKAKRKFDWGEVVDGFKIYACHDGQIDVLAAAESYKFIAAFAGAQGGKTSLVPLVIYKRLRLHTASEPFRALFVSPSVPMRDQSQIVSHLENTFAGTELEGKYHKADRAYRFPNGAEVLFRTADDPTKLDAGVYDLVIIDEAAKKEYTPDCWRRLKVRASSRNAPILAVSTPDLACCIYDEFVAKTKEVRPGIRASKDGKYFMRVWASNQRPGFNLEAFEDAKLTMSPADFARMFEGVFMHYEGLVYQTCGDTKGPLYPVVPTPSRLPSPAMETIGGIDFGFTTDPAVSLMGAVDENGVIWVVDELYQTGLNNDQLAAEVIRQKKRWEVEGNYKFSEGLRTATTTFYCDTEDPKAIATLQQYQINARGKKVKDILPSIKTVDAMFRAGRLKVFDRCTNLVKELKAYQWHKERPVGADHACLTGDTLVTTDRGDVPIRDLMPGDMAFTRQGFKPISAWMMTRQQAVTYTVQLSNGTRLKATSDHPIFVEGKGFIPVEMISYGDNVTFHKGEPCQKQLNTRVESTGVILNQSEELIGSTSNITRLGQHRDTCIGTSGKTCTGLFQPITTFTTKTRTRLTTTPATLNVCRDSNTCLDMPVSSQPNTGISFMPQASQPRRNGTSLKLVKRGMSNMRRTATSDTSITRRPVNSAERNTPQERSLAGSATTNAGRPADALQAWTMNPDSVRSAGMISSSIDTAGSKLVPMRVLAIWRNDQREDVYDITVEDAHEFYANGVLVKNCDALRYMVASYMHGKQITPIDLTTIHTPAEAEQTEREALERLGIDVEARRNQAAKAEEEQKQRRFYEMAFGDLD